MFQRHRRRASELEREPVPSLGRKELDLPTHQLIDLCLWHASGRLENFRRKSQALAEEANGFSLSRQTPELDVSPQLLEVSRRFEENRIVLEQAEARLEELNNVIDEAIRGAEDCRESLAKEKIRLNNDLNRLRSKLCKAPHTASSTQSQIHTVQSRLELITQSSSLLETCHWKELRGGQYEWMDPNIRFQLQELAYTHELLEQKAISAAPEDKSALAHSSEFVWTN